MAYIQIIKGIYHQEVVDFEFYHVDIYHIMIVS
jgi:hypothetical protein